MDSPSHSDAPGKTDQSSDSPVWRLRGDASIHASPKAATTKLIAATAISVSSIDPNSIERPCIGIPVFLFLFVANCRKRPILSTVSGGILGYPSKFEHPARERRAKLVIPCHPIPT
jgi:hypothetical protein